MATSLSDLTSTLKSALANLPSPENIKEEERMQLLGAIGQLQSALETPVQIIQKYCFGHYGIAGIRVAQGMGIFDAFVTSNGAEMTFADLSSKTKGDVELLKRIMRFLCSHAIFKETSSETYRPSQTAMLFGTGSVPGDMIKHFHTNMQMTSKHFEYFEARGYKNPSDAYDAPFQLAYHTNEHYFDWMSKRPEIQSVFNSVMTESKRHYGVEWFEFYPVLDKLQVTPERVALVDVGGGVGHDITALKARFPQLPGKYIVEDLPQVIDDIKEPLPEGINAVKINMFEGQPIKDAKAYYMRTVLHDWPDKPALEVLRHIRQAMASDSILLINEHVMPEGANVPVLSATLDLHMMEVFSALERTEKQWIDLLERAEFKVTKVWKSDAGFDTAVFEATLG
ncbi:S-adenosyl-L-methionine-dependent methyltransferase [Aspergillus caelatus]|uniref:S-adenosyl-L-methionine-dependent methyltransferase n=1 Tax=Aspergillus caelatus TaxID=61420 RepID=A0A5N7AJV0_9EURO|nr:S-adenosyl-L-methionine-dependent methyltransferase [Aspergillus caelatus]KAE8369973.1 S-adenosyl-L-methionine-dependent methyltransferase [Aspergillus caelatus]